MARTPLGRRLWPALVGTAIGASVGAAVMAAGHAASVPSFRRWTATPQAPATTGYDYSLTVRVRPLLFWITRTGVGSGRIVRADTGGGTRVYEFLIGSDPARAPMRINRWG